MRERGQTEENINGRRRLLTHVGVITAAAMAARGRPVPLDPWAYEGDAPKIPNEDQADLRLYFSEELRTASEGGGGSSFNAMLDRLALYDTRSKPCTHCGGIHEVQQKLPVFFEGKPVLAGGKQAEAWQVVVDEKAGSGLEIDSARFQEWKRIELICKRPAGQREIEAWLLIHNPAFEWEEEGTDRNGKPIWRKRYKGYGDYFCQKCEGTGWRHRKLPKEKPTTVNITGQIPKFIRSPSGGSATLERIGRIGRKRAAVRAFDPISEVVLEGKFSPGGDDRHTNWEYTPAGQELLRGNRQKLPPRSYFTILRRAHEKNEENRGRKLTTRHDDEAMARGDLARCFERASQEADQLFARACRVWHKVAIDE